MRTKLGILLAVLGLAGFAAVQSIPPPGAESFGMEPWQAVVMGVVEGVTEFLPVSSTGHLILAKQAFGLGENNPEAHEAIHSYLVVIQVGAILAVVAVYGAHLREMLLGLFGKSAKGRHLLISVMVAFIPAAVAGLMLERWIDIHLRGLWATNLAWLVGGMALVHWGHRSREGEDSDGLEMGQLTPRMALFIGLLQVVAMWPGVSRSLVTILGGRLVGLGLKDSVVFSFLLGMLTLAAATAYKILIGGAVMMESLGMVNVFLGVVVAWFSAWVAVKGMVAYLKKHGLEVFGYYRIALAALTAILILAGKLEPESALSSIGSASEIPKPAGDSRP